MTKFNPAFEGHEIVSRITENAFYGLYEGDEYLGMNHPMFETKFYDAVYGLLWKTAEFRDHMVFGINSNKIPEMAKECKLAIDKYVVSHLKAVMKAVDLFGQEAFRKKYRIRVFMELNTMKLEDGRIGKKFAITSSLVDVSRTGSREYAERAEKLASTFSHSTRRL